MADNLIFKYIPPTQRQTPTHTDVSHSPGDSIIEIYSKDRVMPVNIHEGLLITSSTVLCEAVRALSSSYSTTLSLHFSSTVVETFATWLYAHNLKLEHVRDEFNEPLEYVKILLEACELG